MQHHFLFARALDTLREGWMVHIYQSRSKIESYPLAGDFTSRTAWLIEQERIQQFKFGTRYFNEMAVVFTYQPQDEKYKAAAKFFRDSQDEDPLPGDNELEIFNTGLRSIEGLCGARLRLARLDKRLVNVDDEGEVEVDDRLAFLTRHISGQRQDVRSIPEEADISAAVAQPVRTGLRLRVADDCVSVVTIDSVPASARATLMRDLYNIEQVCDFVIRWIVRDPEHIGPEMRVKRKQLYRDRKSLGQQIAGGSSPFQDDRKTLAASDVNSAVSDAAEGEAYGYISFSIVLRQQVNRAEGRTGEREAWKLLDAGVSKVMTALRRSKFTPRHEVENVFDAWLGTLPGMGFAQVRKGITGSHPFSYLSPLTSVWMGSLLAPCKFYPKGASALSYAASGGSTPLAYNLHVGDVGHTLFVGKTGGGKSTALAFTIAQHERYGQRSRRIIFDLNRSMETLTRSMENGIHIDFSDQGVSLAPFADIRQPGGLDRAQTFVAYLLHVNNVSYGEHRHDIYKALQAMAQAKGLPSVSSLCSAPFLKSTVKEVLQRYTRGNVGGFLDGEVDGFPDAATICIELEHVMSMDDEFKKPLLVALINRVEKLFDGRPTLWVFDEAWKPLNDDLLSKVIGEKLKTLRKANVAMIFGTLSLGDLDGPLGKMIKGPDVPTKIYTGNPDARSPQQAEMLLALGLEPWEIEDIASAGLGEYFIANPDGHRKFSFGLGPVALAFVGASDKDSVAEMREMVFEDSAFISKNGYRPERPWQARWIEKRVGSKMARDWADYWIAGPNGDGKKIFGAGSLKSQLQTNGVSAA